MKARLVQIKESPESSGIVYALRQNKRHLVAEPRIAASNGWDLRKAELITLEELGNYQRSYNVAFNYDLFVPRNIKQFVITSLRILRRCLNSRLRAFCRRHYLGFHFRGRGLEIGAASNPWPCRFGNEMDYGDAFGGDEGCKVGYADKDYVPLDYLASLEDMSAVTQTDYDFICSAHVLEHTPKVIQSLKNVYEHLKPGGIAVMAIPHKEHMFDRYRETTPLEHHIEDYENYQREHDVAHIIDFHENSNSKYLGNEVDIEEQCRIFLEGTKRIDIHYHTFTESSLREILAWFDENVYKWRSWKVYDWLVGSDEFLVKCKK
jgi:predicted SAM-dependent methyltransferase